MLGHHLSPYWIYYGDHFIMYKNIKSLYLKLILCVNYYSIKK